MTSVAGQWLTGPQRWRALLLAYALLVSAVIGHQVTGPGTLGSPWILLQQLEARPGSLWLKGEQLPHRYRPLFRWLVLGVFRVLPQTPMAFYWCFVAASALALWLTVLGLDWLLLGLGYSGRQSALGVVLFCLGFPILFSHDIPVHTREDLLGYAVIAWGLGLAVRERWGALLVLAAVAPWVRETCLLAVLPYWFISGRPPWQRVAVYLVGGTSLLLLRYVQRVPGNPLSWSGQFETAMTAFLAHPVEAVLYVGACFGALWLFAGLRLGQPQPPRHPLLARPMVALAAVLVAATGWFMGIMIEIRITYILFPWVIALALDFLALAPWRTLGRSRLAWLAAVAVLGGYAAFVACLAADPQRLYPVRRVLGDSFHFGLAPHGERRVVGAPPVPLDLAYPPTDKLYPLYASRLSGPYVALHLALAAWLAVAWGTTRAQRRTAAPPQKARSAGQSP